MISEITTAMDCLAAAGLQDMDVCTLLTVYR